MRKRRYEAAKLSELTPDMAHVVRLGNGGGECALVVHAGRCHAVGSLCPHQNVTLDCAPVRRNCVVCPLHGYAFDLATGECATVGGYGIPVYDAQIEDGIVYVSVWEWDD